MLSLTHILSKMVRGSIFAHEIITSCVQPGKLLVDLFPSCMLSFVLHIWCRVSLTYPLLSVMLVPDWFPGAGWKSKARQHGKFNREMIGQPWEKTKRDEVLHIYPSNSLVNFYDITLLYSTGGWRRAALFCFRLASW